MVSVSVLRTPPAWSTSVLWRVCSAALSAKRSFIATTTPGYAGLNVFGLGSGSVKYDADDSAEIAELSLSVMGFI